MLPHISIIVNNFLKAKYRNSYLSHILLSQQCPFNALFPIPYDMVHKLNIIPLFAEQALYVTLMKPYPPHSAPGQYHPVEQLHGRRCVSVSHCSQSKAIESELNICI